MTPDTSTERNFFAVELKRGTLPGAVLNDPAAAVRVFGPMLVMQINCGVIPVKDIQNKLEATNEQ